MVEWIFLVFFISFMALFVYAGVKTVGAVRRRVGRTITQTRRTVEDATLRAKSLGQPGTAAGLAQLRLSLRASMRATQEALRAAVAEDASLAESMQLFERLSVHGRELEEELRQLERDPDRVRVAERIEELRERTGRITHSADSLRWAARDRARKFAEDDLSSLSAQIDVESGALRHWSVAEGEPERKTSRPGPGSGRGAAGERTVTDHVQPVPSPTGAPQAEAIGPADPRRITYPWQERPRQPRTGPEATN
jgi:hypothetical protein